MQEHYSNNKHEKLTTWLSKQKYNSDTVKQALPKTYSCMVHLFSQLDKLFVENNATAFLETINQLKALYTESCNAIEKAIQLKASSLKEDSEDLLLF